MTGVLMSQRGRGVGSAVLAAGAAESLGAPVLPALARTRATQKQATLSPAARRQNVDGAFALAQGATVAALRLLLVDDVVTTGASLTTASDALLAAGARSVRSVVVAATPAPGWRPDGGGRATARVAP